MGETITFEGMEWRVTEYLSDIAARMRSVEAHRERIIEAEADLALHGIALDHGGPCQPCGDAIPDGVARLLESRQGHVDAVAQNSREIDRAWELCSGSGNECAYVLWLHCVHGMGWRRVARVMHASERSVYRMRVDGVTYVYRGMPEEWRRGHHRAI